MKLIFPLLLAILQVTQVFAHSVELFVSDNRDGTILIKAAESDGDPVTGAAIVIRNKETTQPILTLTMPDSGKVNVPMPKVPYSVTVDAGSGHTVTKAGPFTDGKTTQAQARPAQTRATLKSQAVPIGAAAILIFITLALLSVSAKLRKKNAGNKWKQ
jgi:hypothetical protein